LFITQEFIGITPWSVGVPNYLDLFVDGKLLTWFWIGLAIVIGIPLIMLVYLGIKLIFRIRTSNSIIGSVATSIWFLGLILLFIAGWKGLSNFKSTSTSTTQESITTASDTLYLTLGNDEFRDYVDSNLNFDNMRIASVNGKTFLLGAPRLDIEKSDAKEFSMVIKNRSRGRDLDKAQQFTREIKYKYSVEDSLISFQPWFMVPDNSTWKNQEVFITLKVPENKTVFLNGNLVKLIHGIENTTNTWDGDMVGKYWTMKSEGLTLVNRAIPQTETLKNSKK
jgi:hypothetical protein